MTLLLGPPGAGKTTLLQVLAGKLKPGGQLRVSGNVTYNGHTLDEFYPERTGDPRGRPRGAMHPFAVLRSRLFCAVDPESRRLLTGRADSGC